MEPLKLAAATVAALALTAAPASAGVRPLPCETYYTYDTVYRTLFPPPPDEPMYPRDCW